MCVNHIISEDRDFRSRTTVVLLTQIKFHWDEFSADGLDPLRANTRQMIENLLLGIGQADNLRRVFHFANNFPGVLPRILRFIHDDERVLLRYQFLIAAQVWMRRKVIGAKGRMRSGLRERKAPPAHVPILASLDDLA